MAALPSAFERQFTLDAQIFTPVGINYECTGCGTCCGGWSVPMTEADYARVKSYDWGNEAAKFRGKDLFRKLNPSEKANSPYAFAIKEADDGHCPFLVDNLCFIHRTKGAKIKPAICQLFPYCFNETPTGVFCTVSFLSMAVIYNTGKSLAEQQAYLQTKYDDFQNLFPGHHPNWSKLKLTIGQPLSWNAYMEIEERMLQYLQAKGRFAERLLACSAYLVGLVKRPVDQASAPNSPKNNPFPSRSTALNRLDIALIKSFHDLYFADRRGPAQFKLVAFGRNALLARASAGQISLDVAGCSFDLAKLEAVVWPEDDLEIADLLYRYFYSRIFGKLYFGAGFGQLSLIAGFHHLAVLFALIRWHAKALALHQDRQSVCLDDVIATIRRLEKRLGEAVVDAYAAAVLELILFSPTRLQRVLLRCD